MSPRLLHTIVSHSHPVLGEVLMHTCRLPPHRYRDRFARVYVIGSLLHYNDSCTTITSTSRLFSGHDYIHVCTSIHPPRHVAMDSWDIALENHYRYTDYSLSIHATIDRYPSKVIQIRSVGHEAYFLLRFHFLRGSRSSIRPRSLSSAGFGYTLCCRLELYRYRRTSAPWESSVLT